MITLQLTPEEVETLGRVFDVAIKATGLQGAITIMPLHEKVAQAVDAAAANEEIED